MPSTTGSLSLTYTLHIISGLFFLPTTAASWLCPCISQDFIISYSILPYITLTPLSYYHSILRVF